MSVLLDVAGVTVRFGGVRALHQVDFHLEEGELLGLMGPNGAGKTTMLRVVTGVVRPDAGAVRLAGRDLSGLPVHRRVRAGLGLSQQLVRPFATMTVLDNVALAAGWRLTRSPARALGSARRDEARARALRCLARVGIEDAAGAEPAALPLGFLKRLEVARALALEPRLLLLDEPLAGLAHVEAREMADVIADLNREGISVLLIEHNLGELLRVAGRLVVLDNGEKLAEGPPREVMADPRVRTAYLGADDAAA